MATRGGCIGKKTVGEMLISTEILHTNRQLEDEGYTAFYGQNTFGVRRTVVLYSRMV
jgi:hypothetical protein